MRSAFRFLLVVCLAALADRVQAQSSTQSDRDARRGYKLENPAADIATPPASVPNQTSTASGHIEQSTLKKQHSKACELAKVTPFVLYTFRHTCLTQWASILDPYTLAYLAGHRDFATTRRYVHPNLNTAREALERARAVQGGHKIGHTLENAFGTKPDAVRAIA